MATTTKDKRTMILQAALELIAERGFHGAPMSLVAQRAEASAGIIYHYFASKDDLIHALYESVEAGLGKALLIGNPQLLPLPDAFIQIWLNAYRYYLTHPNETRFLEQYKHSPFHQATDMTPEALSDDFVFLAKWINTDRPFKDLPLDVIYEMTMGVAARVANRQVTGQPLLDDTQLKEIAAACWQAVAR